MLIRHADPECDAGDCAAIYGPAVLAGVASLEERAPEPHEMADRIRILSGDYPWLVAELDGRVVGYAYAARHRERASYRWSADVTVYVDHGAHRRGVGRALYAALLELLRRQGVCTVCAGITLPNPASVGLHEAMGFEPIGTYRDIAFKHGQWRSTGWWQLSLRDPAAGAPAQLRPPQRLDAAGDDQLADIATPAALSPRGPLSGASG